MGDKVRAERERQTAQRSKAQRKKGKKRRQRYDAVMRLTAVMVSLLVLALVVIVAAPKRNHTVIINHANQPREVEIAAPPLEEDDSDQILRINTTYVTDSTVFEDEPTAEPAEPLEAAEPEPTAQPEAEALAQSAPDTLELTVPATATFEYLPVYKRADVYEPKIAITVDDCFQVENLQTICTTAYKNGGKLTIFPIGENLSKSGMADTLKTCVFKLGYEVENHTWSHERIFRLPEYEMAKQIWDQSQAVNLALGVNYQQHFFRLMGGDGSSDQRTHSYLKQLGFKGIAEWSLSGSDAEFDEICAHLQPGAIYLFHTTDRDTEMLKRFIPYVAAQGYQMVTMNELLGFEDNAISEYSAQAMPVPQPYEEDYRTHKVGDYAWNIVRMQDKLRSMGLLVMDGASTGYYGKQTAAAIQAYQEQQGLPATGEADSETQRRLLQAET